MTPHYSLQNNREKKKSAMRLFRTSAPNSNGERTSSLMGRDNDKYANIVNEDDLVVSERDVHGGTPDGIAAESQKTVRKPQAENTGSRQVSTARIGRMGQTVTLKQKNKQQRNKIGEAPPGWQANSIVEAAQRATHPAPPRNAC